MIYVTVAITVFVVLSLLTAVAFQGRCGVFAGNSVWSTSERLVVEILTIGAIQVRFLSFPFPLLPDLVPKCPMDTSDCNYVSAINCHVMFVSVLCCPAINWLLWVCCIKMHVKSWEKLQLLCLPTRRMSCCEKLKTGWRRPSGVRTPDKLLTERNLQVHYHHRAFLLTAVQIWNSLLEHTISVPTLQSFGHHLKTFLLQRSFCR